MDFQKYPFLELFNELTDKEQGQLLLRNFKAKEAIIKEVDRGDFSLYMLLSGIMKCDQRRVQNEIFFSRYKLSPGEFIGLREIISPYFERRETTILAETDVTVLEIPGSTFLSWQTEYPKLYNTIIYKVLGQQFGLRKLLTNCASQDTLGAGAYYFVHLYQIYLQSSYPSDYKGDVRILDTRKEIGEALAKTSRSVDRIIKIFREEGLIGTNKGKVTINADQFKKLSEYTNIPPVQ